MKRFFDYRIFFIGIIIIAIFLRFYQLGINPPSLDWDEASLGYNAYSVLKTGADEYGNKFPLSIRSFDDYKPPLYVYLTIPSIAIFGLNEFSVRFPSAVLGVLTVIIVYLLVKELLNHRTNQNPSAGLTRASTELSRMSSLKTNSGQSNKTEIIALLSMFFAAISPWSLQFSRTAFEGNIGLFLFALGTLLFLKGLENKKLLVLSAFSFGFDLYSYHSFRLLVPIFILLMLVIYWKKLLNEKKFLIIFLSLTFLFFLPIGKSFLMPEGSGARLSMVTIFGGDTLNSSIKQLEYDQSKNDPVGAVFHNRRVVYALAILKGYFDHFNLDFLFLHGDGGRQHHAVNMGMLYLFDLPFILIGIYALIKKFNKKILALFLWFLIAPFPSAITTGTPHPVRAIAMVLPFHIFSAFGIIYFLSKIFQVKKSYGYLCSLVISVFLLFNTSYYLHQYYVHTPVEYGDFWQYGNKQALEEVTKLEKNSNKIIFSFTYDQPYIYYLFYNKVDPVWYQKNWNYRGDGSVERMRRVIGKYEFRNVDWGEDKNLKNAIIVGSPREIPKDANVIKEIKYLNGSVAYRIVKT